MYYSISVYILNALKLLRMIREAKSTDSEQIKSIINNYILDREKLDDFVYCAKKQRDGFIATADFEDLQEKVHSSKLFNVYEKEETICGFIVANRELYFPEEAQNIIWLDKNAKEVYFHGEKSIELHYIAVEPSYKNKGVATKLFEQSISELKNEGFTDLFSIVALGPLTNCSSIIWHTKRGFKRVCVTMPFDIFGMKDYQSILFHREL